MQDFYWLFLIVALVLFLGIGFLIYIKGKRAKLSQSDVVFFQQMWRQVDREKIRMPGKAVLDADKIVDKVMHELGYRGSFGEKLKKQRSVFSDINGIWRAHKLRNKVAHELDFIPNEKQVADALVQFKKALRDLGLRV